MTRQAIRNQQPRRRALPRTADIKPSTQIKKLKQRHCLSFESSPARVRTTDPVVNSHLLCLLSYRGKLINNNEKLIPEIEKNVKHLPKNILENIGQNSWQKSGSASANGPIPQSSALFFSRLSYSSAGCLISQLKPQALFYRGLSNYRGIA